MNRAESIMAMRPIIERAAVNSGTTTVEAFQQTTLRPVIKLQSELLMRAMEHAFKPHESQLYQLPDANKQTYISNWLNKSPTVMCNLQGMVVGMFILEELTYYMSNKKELDKRIKNMLAQRFAEKTVSNVKK